MRNESGNVIERECIYCQQLTAGRLDGKPTCLSCAGKAQGIDPRVLCVYPILDFDKARNQRTGEKR